MLLVGQLAEFAEWNCVAQGADSIVYNFFLNLTHVLTITSCVLTTRQGCAAACVLLPLLIGGGREAD